MGLSGSTLTVWAPRWGRQSRFYPKCWLLMSPATPVPAAAASSRLFEFAHCHWCASTGQLRLPCWTTETGQAESAGPQQRRSGRSQRLEKASPPPWLALPGRMRRCALSVSRRPRLKLLATRRPPVLVRHCVEAGAPAPDLERGTLAAAGLEAPGE